MLDPKRYFPKEPECSCSPEYFRSQPGRRQRVGIKVSVERLSGGCLLYRILSTGSGDTRP